MSERQKVWITAVVCGVCDLTALTAAALLLRADLSLGRQLPERQNLHQLYYLSGSLLHRCPMPVRLSVHQSSNLPGRRLYLYRKCQRIRMLETNRIDQLPLWLQHSLSVR